MPPSGLLVHKSRMFGIGLDLLANLLFVHVLKGRFPEEEQKQEEQEQH